MPASSGKKVGVIGAGMVGVCAASYLQRQGHEVSLSKPASRDTALRLVMPVPLTRPQ